MSIGQSILGLFAKSPIKPLQQHYEIAIQCASELPRFFEAVIREDWQAAAAKQQDIARLESEADKVKKEIRLHVPKTLFLPIARPDLLDLIAKQDKVANRTKDIAGLMLGRQMIIPEPMQQAMLEFVNTSIDVVVQTGKAISELDELIETGFGNRGTNLVKSLVEEGSRLEKVSDEKQVAVRAQLFKLEQELPPVNVMFLYRVIDWIGDLGDRAQGVGSQLHILIAR